MAVNSRTLSIDLIARNRASDVFRQVGTDAERAAGKSSTAFTSSTSRIGTSVSKLGSTLGSFGVPFASTLSVVGDSLDRTATKGGNFGSTMSKVGGVELVAAAAGVALVGRSSVNAAREFEGANTRLQVAVDNTGQSFDAAEPSISKTDAAMRKLGFTDTETESSLSRLTGVTHSLVDAQKLQTLAADTARSQHISLADATTILVQAEAGRLRGIGKIIGSTKDANGKTITTTEAFRRLNAVVGGQGVAFMSTFDGKLAAVSAQADKLEVTLGSALIPKIETLASGTVGVVQGFESANTATDGFLGKAVALGAAIPVAVFAGEKLVSVGGRIGDQYGKLGRVLGTTETATEGVGAAQAATAAQTAGGVAASEAAAVAAARVTVAQQAEGVAAAELAVAEKALTAALADEAATSGSVVAAARARDAAAARLAVTQTKVAAAEGAAAATNAEFAVGAAATVGTLSTLALGIGAAAAAYIAYKHSADDAKKSGFGSSPIVGPSFIREPLSHLPGLETLRPTKSPFNSTDVEAGAQFAQSLQVTSASADRMGLDLKAAQAAVTAYTAAALQGKSGNAAFFGTLSLIGPQTRANGDAINSYTQGIDQATKSLSPSEKASLAAAAAAKKYADDLALGHVPARQLATDKAAAAAAGSKEAAIQREVNAATNASVGATSAAKFGYLGLADGIKTVADASAALSAQALDPIRLSIQVDTDKSNVAAALDALNHPDTSGGGSGGGQTATAKALDAQQKVLSVRDAERSLVQAQRDARTAQTTLTDARKKYNDVNDGVSRSSRAAKDAIEANTRAQDDERSSTLSLIDAKRTLRDAKDALANAPKDAREAIGSANRGVQGARLDVAAARESVASAVEGGDSVEIARAKIALGDAQQRLTDAIEAQIEASKNLKDVQKGSSKENEDVKRATIAVTEAQLDNTDSKRAATEAQRVLNGTLNGFPPVSQEAKDATNQLADAQRGLQSALDQTKTAQLGLERSTADLQGKLESLGGGGAGKKLDDLTTRINAARTAILGYADDARAADLQASHSIGHSILVEIQTLQSYVDANPLLKDAFGSALATLEAKFVAEVSNQAFKTGKSIVPGGPGHAVGRDSHAPAISRATGGPVPGNDPSGIPILAHPGEFVIQRKAVDRYGPHMMELLNEAKLDLPKFATGGPVGAGATGTATPLTATFTAGDTTKAGSDLVGGFYKGAKREFDTSLVPFLTSLKAETAKPTKDSREWLKQPATDLMQGFYQATQEGYAPTRDFFATRLEQDLKAGAKSAAGAVKSGWDALGPAFAGPANFAISHVLNPLIQDVNQIARAVGMDDIAKGLKPVGSFAKGGVIPKTGLAHVHEGEGVIPKSAMQFLTQEQFDAIKTGQMVKDIDKSIASQPSGTGAERIVSGAADRAADDVKKFVASLKVFAQQTTARGPFGKNVVPLGAIEPNSGGFAGALTNARRQHGVTGIPTSVMLTQSANETGGWTSDWYLNHNNPAGIGVTGAPGAGFSYPTVAAGWADYAQKLLGHGEAGQGQFVADLQAGASALQLLRDIETSPWAGGHYGGHGLEALYPTYAKYAAGGPIKGRDPKGIPILAHPGEFVVTQKAVNKYGLKAMDSLNKGNLEPFARGGSVPGSKAATPELVSVGSPRGGHARGAVSITFAPGSIVVNGTDDAVGPLVAREIIREVDRYLADNGR